MSTDCDVLVIGAGMGGLGAALSLAEAGVRVSLSEALTYPGGCAATFQRRGYRFEAGATLSSGLGADQLFGRWIDRYQLPVRVEWMDPLVELRTPDLRLPVRRDRAAFQASLAALPGAPVEALRSFFADQRAVADTLWQLFDDPALLPPLSAESLVQHLRRLPRYLPLLGLVGRPLSVVLARYGLDRWPPLRSYLEGLCQITVQCGVDEAEAPFAMAAMDYYWRGTGHIRGGIGALAVGLVAALRGLGADVRMADRVTALRWSGDHWRVQSRSGERRARRVVANLLPGDLGRLLAPEGPGEGAASPWPWESSLSERQASVSRGWGAVMLYRVVRAPPGSAHHLDLCLDPQAPWTEGNHVFVSLSGAEDARGERPGERVLTASTHVALERLRETDAAPEVERIQAAMRRTVRELAPEIEEVVFEMTASPRTFARFTRRAEGAVGGVPRRAGLAAYAQLGPVSPRPGLWLVGDSVFPGQSTLATAVGGTRVAAAILRAGFGGAGAG